MTPSQNNYDIKKIASLGLFLALAVVCGYIESLIPYNFGVPGMKLGITNIIVVLILYLFGPIEAIIVSVLRIFLVGFMFGNAFSIVYSLAGGLLSFLVMYFLKRISKLAIISISLTGGIFHNIGQIIVALIVLQSKYLLYYVPILLISGAICGLIIGFIAQLIYPRLRKLIKEQV